MTLSIQATKRVAKRSQETRAQGLIPGVVYGSGRTPEALAVSAIQLQKLYDTAGEATLVDLLLESAAPTKVLIHEVQHDPVKGNIIHVDFRQIDMNKSMHAVATLRFVGESLAVKELGGTLVKTVSDVNVECLPQDLVNHIDVDLSTLKTFEAAIRMADLVLPPGIAITDHLDTVVVKVTAPLTEEELKAMEEVATVDLSKIEVEEKGKKEEEEGEGEEAASSEDKAKK